MQRRILIVEDHRDIADLIAMHLRDGGMQADVAYDGTSGLDRVLNGHYDLVILDLMLPGVEGLELCRRLRRSDAYTPVLMLTAKSSEADRVAGLEIGADDYLTKPFSLRELLARVRAIFRRVEALAGEGQGEGATVQVGDLVVDADRRSVTLGGEEVNLTAREFDLLWYFITHPGRVFSRSQLLDQVWGFGHEGYEHTVNSHINRLRAKIEHDPAHPQYILTVWGVGYKFVESSAAAGTTNGAGKGTGNGTAPGPTPGPTTGKSSA